jgi:YVTN family beta-propeller protein
VDVLKSSQRAAKFPPTLLSMTLSLRPTRVAAASKLRFHILGPLEVWSDGAIVDLGAQKQRAVLAILLLNANRVVATERLIDELWGEKPPETARSALQVYVAALRKALGGEASALRTSAPGYVLDVEPGALDLDRFIALRAEAQAAGDEERRSELLREALGLWRDTPLADLSAEPFAAKAVARLEDLRLEALEQRVDADLALGRHASLVPELEVLVAEQPYRERLRAQLMLALYRSGRQADALGAYQEGRRLLMDELGLEPGDELKELERSILQHDVPAAPVPRQPSDVRADSAGHGTPWSPPLNRERTRRRRWVVATAATVVVAGTASALAFLSAGGSSPRIWTSTNAVGVIDPATNRVVDEVPVGAGPGPLTVGGGAVWVANLQDESVSRIDPVTRAVTTVPAGGLPADVAFGAGAVWVFLSRTDGFTRIDPAFNERSLLTMKIDRFAGSFTEGNRCGAQQASLAIDGQRGWIACAHTRLERVDLRNGVPSPTAFDVGGVFVPLQFSDVAFGLGSAWVLNSAANTVTEIDSVTNVAAVPRAITVGRSPSAIAAGGDSLWVVNREDDTVMRVRLGRGHVPEVTTIDVGDGPVDVDVGPDAVWVANSLDGTVARVDPATNSLAETIEVGGEPGRIAAGAGFVWVTRGPMPAQPAPG